MSLLLLVVALVCAVVSMAMGFDWIHDPHALSWLSAATVFFIAAHIPFDRYFR